jgi:hypothetical protein
VPVGVSVGESVGVLAGDTVGVGKGVVSDVCEVCMEPSSPPCRCDCREQSVGSHPTPLRGWW